MSRSDNPTLDGTFKIVLADLARQSQRDMPESRRLSRARRVIEHEDIEADETVFYAGTSLRKGASTPIAKGERTPPRKALNYNYDGDEDDVDDDEEEAKLCTPRQILSRRTKNTKERWCARSDENDSVHLSQKRFYESDQKPSDEKREREGLISVTRTRDRSEGETDERNWRKTKKSAGGKRRRRRGKGEGSAGILRKLSRNAYSKRAEVPHTLRGLVFGNAMRRASWCMEKRCL